MFQCFFDDSGKDNDLSNRFVVIAGYLAVDEVWGRFQNSWGHLLIKHGLPGIHMREIVGIARKKGWDTPKLNAVLSEFIGVIREGLALIGFGVAVDADEYRNFLAGGSKRKLMFGDAHEFICSRIVRRVRDRLTEAGLHAEQMAILFDQDFELARRRLTLFEHICKRDPPLKASLATLSFADARHYYPLQAADLLAWETRRQIINRTEGKPSAARWNDLMSALPSGQIEFACGEFWNKQLIEEKLPEIEANELTRVANFASSGPGKILS